MAAASAISCSTNVGSYKKRKNWRETVKFLNRVDRVGVLRRMGFVLTLDKVALRRTMDRKYAGQWQRKDATVE